MKAASVVVAWFFAVMACPGICRAEVEPGGAERTPRTLAPYFFVENGDPSIDQVPLEATTVDVVVSGVIANVRVTQVYVNRGSRPIHARYVFPGSTRAAVHGMTMTIGDRRVVARIQEREAAQATYQKARSEGKSASLLEQSRPNVFSMRVANILPGDRIEVELKYTELLTPEERRLRVRVSHRGRAPVLESGGEGRPGAGPLRRQPLSRGRRRRQDPLRHPGRARGRGAHARADLPVAPDVDRVGRRRRRRWSGSIRRRATAAIATSSCATAWPASASRRGSSSTRARTRASSCVMAQPPQRVAASDVPPREYIFVVDVSGSMTGFPLDTAKKLLRDLIGRLKPTDTFNVLLFSGTSHLMSPRSVPASAANMAAAIRVIDEQGAAAAPSSARRSTAPCSIPRTDGFARSVVLVTDGFISAEADVFGLIAANLGRTNFFAFGIGSSVNRHLIEGVARAGQGEPFVVTGPEEAALVSDRFRRYIESPVLTNISIAAEGFDAYDLEPAGFPDLLAERPLVALGKWRGDGRGPDRDPRPERERTVRAGARRRRRRPVGRQPGARPAVGTRARRRARRFRVDQLRPGAPGRHRRARPEVRPAHGLHLLRRGPRGGEESGRRGSGCRLSRSRFRRACRTRPSA